VRKIFDRVRVRARAHPKNFFAGACVRVRMFLNFRVRVRARARAPCAPARARVFWNYDPHSRSFEKCIFFLDFCKNERLKMTDHLILILFSAVNASRLAIFKFNQD
jgi:hypothetical protein